MPRRNLGRSEGQVFHVLNRAIRRVRIFCNHSDYEMFEKVLVESTAKVPIRLLAYCIMPNHWHLVLWPQAGELPAFMHLLTMTHAKRWHVVHSTTGTGSVYQNRYYASPRSDGASFYNLIRYVERNPVRAGLVQRAEDWPWSSASQRSAQLRLADWPLPRPENWLEILNAPSMLPHRQE